jgi:hypothetical protein
MKVRRDVISVPAQSARETWRAIIDLITDRGSIDVQQLEAASSVMESLIADETPATTPIVIKGTGPRLVIYCLYGEKAMEGAAKPNPLTWNPTGGEWHLIAPCEADDVTWMNATLTARAPRIRVQDNEHYDADLEEAADTALISGRTLTVDWDAVAKR